MLVWQGVEKESEKEYKSKNHKDLGAKMPIVDNFFKKDRSEGAETDDLIHRQEKIAKALGVSLIELFASTDELKAINLYRMGMVIGFYDPDLQHKTRLVQSNLKI
jgi:hypothetical protein